MAGLTARVMAVSIAEGESTLEELMGESGFTGLTTGHYNGGGLKDPARADKLCARINEERNR